MFIKTFSFLIAFSVFSAQAQVASHQDLKSVVDEFQFALTVEWDQKDKSFYDAQTRKFQKSLESLQAQGMSDLEMLDYLKSTIKDERVSKDLDQLYQQVSLNKISRSEVQKLVKETFSKTYNQGANWNGSGSATIAVAVVVIIAAVLIFSSISNSKNGSRSGETGGEVTPGDEGGTHNPPHGYCYDSNNCEELNNDPELNWVQACQPNWVCTQ